jgi:hypothetical protein
VLDTVDLLGILWSSLGWILPFMLVVTGLQLAFKARTQGWIGERVVAGGLKKHVHAALHDVIVPDGRGGLTQIDHLLLSDQGIWVVETKTFTGRIFGRERDRQWTQRLGRRSFRIGNPLRQNYGHLKAVEAIVGQDMPVLGRVVMAGSASFPKGMPSGVSTGRAFRRELAGSRTGQQLPGDWVRAWRELESQVQKEPEARKAHRRQLEEKHGRDLRPVVGAAMLGTGLLLAAWMVVT